MIKENENLIIVSEDGKFSSVVGPISSENILEIIKSLPHITDFYLQKDLSETDFSDYENLNEELATLYIDEEILPHYDSIENAENYQWLVKTDTWENFIESLADEE